MSCTKMFYENMFYVVILLMIATAIAETVPKEPDVKDENLDYAKGSVCSYCEYCQFCKLCDDDCPCDPTPSKPNCHMCKYCKYCYLCSALCDTICKPGGILDKVSSSIVNALPSFDKGEVDNDIGSVKTWIDNKRDEL